MFSSSAALFLGVLSWGRVSASSSSCDTVDRGYQCSPDISHYWGQYSPFFAVESNISAAIPARCYVTFAQVLSRHGARSPTASKTKSYNDTIVKIQKNTQSYDASVAFLKNFTYRLGSDELTTFGEQEMYNSGVKFLNRYESLASSKHLFVRASSESRVVQSAKNFTQGFHDAMLKHDHHHNNKSSDFPYNITIISEASGSNNTLNHDLCTNFENESDTAISARGQGPWTSIFIPPITKRLNTLLKGANLTTTETINMMDLCPFTTVSSPIGVIATNFCDLFTETEWKQYDYYQSLGKFYHYGGGDPLGPTQGVGFTNELIARLTHEPVDDHTSTNSTLDSNPATFPLGRDDVLFADFSHDNDMTAIFFALGLYNDTKSLDAGAVRPAGEVGGYSAAWTVPFAARLYVEKLSCGCDGTDVADDEYIRFIVNDRVIPLSCSDEEGKCRLDEYLDTLGFAREGEKWAQCFT